MDLRSYLGPLRRKFPLILAIALLSAGGAYAWSMHRGETSYAGELYVTIAYTDDQDSPDYRYGNYYANFASIEFARTVSGWLQATRTVEAIYAEAGVDMRTDVGLLGRLFGPISMKRVERANLLMGFTSTSRENAERLMAALRDTLSERIAEYNRASATRYAAVNPQAVIQEQTPDPPLSATLGLLAGLVLGIVLAYAVEYGSGAVVSPDQLDDLAGSDPSYVLRRSDPALPEVLAAHLARSGGAPVLLGASLDPSGLAVRVAKAMREQGERVTIIEGEQGLGLSRQLRGPRMAGWADEQRAAKGAAKTTAKLSPKLLRPVATDVALAPHGRGRGSFARALAGAPGTAMGVLTFPRAARQLVDLPPATPILVIAQLGLTRQRDLRHLRSFLSDRPHAFVLLS